jgi:DNA-binding response OmpR family regulator
MNRSRPGSQRNSTTSPTWAWYAASMTRVLLVGADPALGELLEEWLAGEGCAAVRERPHLVLVDLPFPRERGAELLRQLAQAHPDAPVMPMPKPLTRDAFVAALRRAQNEVQ